MPGLAWSVGLSAVWVLVGTTGGAIFQWIVYARPFMERRKETGVITPIGLLAEKLPGDSPIVRALLALVTFVFYIGYVGAQFLAGGNIFQNAFGIDPVIGILLIAPPRSAPPCCGWVRSRPTKPHRRAPCVKTDRTNAQPVLNAFPLTEHLGLMRFFHSEVSLFAI